MNNKEIAKRIDEIIADDEPFGTIDVKKLEALRDQLDPPTSKPVPVVWWRYKTKERWLLGIIHYSGLGVITAGGSFLTWDKLEWKPACILGPDEVAVPKDLAENA